MGAARGQMLPQLWSGERRRPAHPITSPAGMGRGSFWTWMLWVLGRHGQPHAWQSAQSVSTGRNVGTALGSRDPHLHPGLLPSSRLGCPPNSTPKRVCKDLPLPRHCLPNAPCSSPNGHLLFYYYNFPSAPRVPVTPDCCLMIYLSPWPASIAEGGRGPLFESQL